MELRGFFSIWYLVLSYNLSFVLGKTCVSLGQVPSGLPPANVEAMLAVAVPGAQRVIVRQVRRQRSLSRVGGLVGCLPPGDVGFDAAAISRRLATAAPTQLDGACPAKAPVGRVPPRPKCSRYDSSAVAVTAILGWIRRWRQRVFTSGDTHAKLKLNATPMCVWVPSIDFVNRNYCCCGEAREAPEAAAQQQQQQQRPCPEHNHVQVIARGLHRTLRHCL